jgi:hypothetical protein
MNMAKRFIDTNLFKKGFVKQLPTEYKLLYIYLFCECDHCGIWEAELDVASIRIGIDVSNASKALEIFDGKVVSFDRGKKWFVPQFITFQYGKLTSANKIHKSVVSTLNANGLMQFLESDESLDEELPNPYVTLTEDLPNPYTTLTEEYQKTTDTLKDKDKDKDMDKYKLKEKEKINKKEKENQNADAPAVSQNVHGCITGDVSDSNALIGITLSTEEKSFGKSKRIKSDDFQKFVDVYDRFCKLRKLPTRITAADGSALKQAIAYLSKIESVVSGEKNAEQIFTFILENWNNLTTWQQTQTQLRQINSQLPSMIETLKQHYNGKKQNSNKHSELSSLANALRSAITTG